MTAVSQWDGATPPPSVSCNPNLTPTQTVDRHRVWYTDSQIARVSGTDLLHAYLVMAAHAPAHPVPDRFDDTKPPGCDHPFNTSALASLWSVRVALAGLNWPGDAPPPACANHARWVAPRTSRFSAASPDGRRAPNGRSLRRCGHRSGPRFPRAAARRCAALNSRNGRAQRRRHLPSQTSSPHAGLGARPRVSTDEGARMRR